MPILDVTTNITAARVAAEIATRGAMVGPNGAGKSMLLRCLYRFFLAVSGHASRRAAVVDRRMMNRKPAIAGSLQAKIETVR